MAWTDSKNDSTMVTNDTHEFCLKWRHQTGPTGSCLGTNCSTGEGGAGDHELQDSSGNRVRLCLKHINGKKNIPRSHGAAQ